MNDAGGEAVDDHVEAVENHLDERNGWKQERDPTWPLMADDSHIDPR